MILLFSLHTFASCEGLLSVLFKNPDLNTKPWPLWQLSKERFLCEENGLADQNHRAGVKTALKVVQ